MPEVIDNVKVGEFIKNLLKNKKMSQDDLAQHLMISKSAVSQNLNGKSSFDIQNLLAIAKLFDISLDDLLNMKSSSKDETYISEYEKAVNKGLSELKKANPKDLQIQEPDLYGKVLIDYVIDQKKIDIFTYLNDSNVEFVKDYYHRSKEIYLKTIRYILQEEIRGVMKYILKYASALGSFEIEEIGYSLEIWNLLNHEKYISTIEEMMNAKISIHTKCLKLFSHHKDIKILSKSGWVKIIGENKLDVVLECYLKKYSNRSDFLNYVTSMLESGYHQGINRFIEYYFSNPLSANERYFLNTQQAIQLVTQDGDLDLFKVFVTHQLYYDLTRVIIIAIQNHQQKIHQYCLVELSKEETAFLDFRSIGKAIVKDGNLSLLKVIHDRLSTDDMCFLLSETNPDDLEIMHYLLSIGAKVDFKYYNNSTLERTNNIIDFFMKRGVK